MGRKSLKPVIEPWTLDQLAGSALAGRPFLHEQGNWVTRGFVRSFALEGDHWRLALRDVQHLDKSDGRWVADADEDSYSGANSHTCVTRYLSGGAETGIELSCYGLYIYIGRCSDRPWQDTDWPELDTDFLSPGPMRD